MCPTDRTIPGDLRPETLPTAIILAAGSATRMGFPKWQLRRPSGEYFAEFIYTCYTRYGSETVIVLNEADFTAFAGDIRLSALRAVCNPHPEWGRFYSLMCGLQSLPAGRGCFVQNIDNPFVDEVLLQSLADNLPGNQYVFPLYRGRGGHPLLLGPEIVRSATAITAPYPQLREFLKGFRGMALPCQSPEVLLNINTPGDYRNFLQSRLADNHLFEDSTQSP